MNEKVREDRGIGIGHLILRIVVSCIVLAITAFLTPGFAIANIWSLIIAAVVIGALDYLVVKFTKLDASPFGRGIIGFVISAAIIYFTGYLVSGVVVTFWGAIIAAIIIGIIDMVVPGRQTLE
jgi:putative membrane protein